MATYANTDLSTLESIAAIEAEINNLSKPYMRKAVSVASTVQLTASPDTITTIQAVKSNNTSINLVKGGGTWALPAGEYIRFVLNDGDYFNLTDGTGSVVTSYSGLYTLSFGSAPTWSNVTLVSTWQPKIDKAKEIIYNRLLSSLTGKIDSSEIPTVIEGIVNPEVLSLASDYKTMELIYVDLLGKIGDRDAAQAKLDYYAAQYEQHFKDAYNALDFGDYGYIFTNEMGRLSR